MSDHRFPSQRSDILAICSRTPSFNDTKLKIMHSTSPPHTGLCPALTDWPALAAALAAGEGAQEADLANLLQIIRRASNP